MRRSLVWLSPLIFLVLTFPVAVGASSSVRGIAATSRGAGIVVDVQLGNLLLNPNFDVDLSSWVVPASVTWQAVDADGSPHSGSAVVTGDPHSSGFFTAAQCVLVTTGEPYELSAKMINSNPNLSGGPELGVEFYTSANCSTGPLGTLIAIDPVQSAGQFQSVFGSAVAPAGARSAQIFLGGVPGPNHTANTVTYDDLYFGAPAPGSCSANVTTLCLDDQPNDHRFVVLMHYATTEGGGRSGAGNDINTSSLGIDRGGLFWFFAANNPEALVKVINGCATNSLYWVFISAGTNVGVDVTVADTVTGDVAVFHNPDLDAFPSIQDTAVFPCTGHPAATDHLPAPAREKPANVGSGNLLTNANFDTNVSSWDAPPAAVWQPVDADGSSRSGSAQVTYPRNGGGSCPMQQCVRVTAGTTYAASVKVSDTDADTGVGAIAVHFTTSTDCTGDFLGGAIELFPNQSSGPFQTLSGTGVAPAGAASALVWLCGSESPANTKNIMSYDDVYFGPPAVAPCLPGATTLCVDDQPGDQRFQVQMHYETVQGGGQSGTGNAISTSSLGVDRGGLFWFFEANNPEALVKVINGCVTDQFYWVFISAGTNVGVDITVGDTLTGAVALYHNPDLGAFPSVQDTAVFPCSD